MRDAVRGEERGRRVARIDDDERGMIEINVFDKQRIDATSDRSEPDHHQSARNSSKFLFLMVQLMTMMMMMMMMMGMMMMISIRMSV
jgi:hypothetical protein